MSKVVEWELRGALDAASNFYVNRRDFIEAMKRDDGLPEYVASLEGEYAGIIKHSYELAHKWFLNEWELVGEAPPNAAYSGVFAWGTSVSIKYLNNKEHGVFFCLLDWIAVIDIRQRELIELIDEKVEEHAPTGTASQMAEISKDCCRAGIAFLKKRINEFVSQEACREQLERN